MPTEKQILQLGFTTLSSALSKGDTPPNLVGLVSSDEEQIEVNLY